ncbi:S1 family peptidase [Bdellovibrio bacteriovorus]|uniref:S1 family peptidase n=1 Tax=Bdellovibrio bacteriovorus TaxID=959 RepID=UPI0009C04565|nr:trypsin-like serine protease [Bdellovibrio bacteriovorus]
MSRSVLVLGLIALVSCTPKSQPGVELKKDAAIMGGSMVAENAAIASGIVGIYDTQDNSICTGSLISENLVLTAAHCATSKPSKLKIVFGVDIDATMSIREPDVQQELTRTVSAIQVHSSYKPEEQEEKETDWGDIAILKFPGKLPAGYKPVALLQDDSILKKGFVVTLAGYGVSHIDLEPIDARKVRDIEEAIEYGEVICDDNLKNCLKVDMSGDGELRQTTAPVSFLTETEVFLDESKGRGTCSGDSGGPAYVQKNGQYFLFGITSRGSQLCDSVGVYTNTVYYNNWIRETALKLSK